MINFIKIVSSILALIIIGCFVVIFFRQKDFSKNTEAKSTVTTLPTPLPSKVTSTPFPQQPFQIAAWVPDWGSTAGLNSLNQSHPFKFTEISPVWYEVKADGSLSKKFPANKEKLLTAIKKEGARLIPTIAMFDHELFSKVLNDKVSFDLHVAQILEEVKINNYDGIDLDYESTQLADKELYFALIQALAVGLHAENKVLVVTVVPKWGDFVIYSSLPETRKVQDWARIAKYADTIRIMAYDFTYIKSAFPGPIAPDSWLNEVLDYAITKAPAEKYSLGVALYAYQWSWDATQEEPPYITNFILNKEGTTAAQALTYNDVLSILKNNKGELEDFESEKIFRYTSGNKKYLITYQDETTIKTKIDLAKKYGLSGVCFWRLGNEGELLKLTSVS
jgi:spore germination protein YaaH